MTTSNNAADQAMTLFNEALAGLDTVKTEVTKVVGLLPQDAQDAIGSAVSGVVAKVTGAQAAHQDAVVTALNTPAPGQVIAAQAQPQGSGSSGSVIPTAVVTNTGDRIGYAVVSAEHQLAIAIQAALDSYIAVKTGGAGAAVPTIEDVANSAIQFASTNLFTYVNGLLRGAGKSVSLVAHTIAQDASQIPLIGTAVSAGIDQVSQDLNQAGNTSVRY